jgi:plasmid maintenance system antidote protein VapI
MNSKLLAVLMAERGMTPQDLAKRLKVCRSTVHNMLQGRHIRLYTAVKVAKIFGRSLNEIAPSIVRKYGLSQYADIASSERHRAAA